MKTVVVVLAMLVGTSVGVWAADWGQQYYLGPRTMYDVAGRPRGPVYLRELRPYGYGVPVRPVVPQGYRGLADGQWHGSNPLADPGVVGSDVWSR